MPEHDEPSMVPSAIVAHVGAEEGLDVSDFCAGGIGRPEAEMLDKPLPVGPDVVVFGVLGEHAGKKGDFVSGEGGQLGHDYLSVVPA